MASPKQVPHGDVAQAVARSKALAAQLDTLAFDVVGWLPCGIEIGDIPAETWRRMQLATDLRYLAAAVRRVGESTARTARERGATARPGLLLDITGALAFADLVLDDSAKVVSQSVNASFNALLDTLDQQPGDLQDACRRAWVTRQVRNLLLAHRHPDLWGTNDVAADGMLRLKRVHRGAEPSADSDRALAALSRLLARLGRHVPEHYEEASLSVLAVADRMAQRDRQLATEAFKVAGLVSPPILDLVDNARALVRALPSAPAVPMVRRSRAPGERVTEIVGPMAPDGRRPTHVRGVPVIASYIVAGPGDSPTD